MFGLKQLQEKAERLFLGATVEERVAMQQKLIELTVQRALLRAFAADDDDTQDGAQDGTAEKEATL